MEGKGGVRGTFPGLEQAGPVHASGNTTRTGGVLGEQVVGLQILQTLDATKRHAAAAIGSTGRDGAAKIGILALHGNEATLFVPTQIANVVGNRLYVTNPFGTIH